MLLSGLNMYKKRFDRRYQSNPAEVYLPGDFPGLQAQSCSFVSDHEQKLMGYWYSHTGQTIQGVLVLAHGLCGGHRNYLDVCSFFAEHGFLVFTYDATANGESEGRSVGGFPQGVADLDHALRYVKAQERCRDLPIVLFGHSWGGYAVCSLLEFQPDVRAVISVSGFDSSAVMLAQAARAQLGWLTDWIVPLFVLRERRQWGRYASASAMKGFAKSGAQIMVIHSEDDETVHMQSGCDRYHKAYAGNKRFRFVKLSGRGHNHPLHENGVRGTLDAALMRDILDFALHAIRRNDDAV
ncbi:MAG: alpha/beta fold hydrolase [Clostridia bacterium]|nr:alpha/beta fold hydrolase [Clostridia bacterium]